MSAMSFWSVNIFTGTSWLPGAIHMNKKGVRDSGPSFKMLARPLKKLAQNSESRRKEKRAYTLDPRAVNLSTKCGV